MGENIAEAGSNKLICRGSMAYRMFALTSLLAMIYNDMQSITYSAWKQGYYCITLCYLTAYDTSVG